MIKYSLMLLALVSIAGNAQALEQVAAKITVIEPTYLPNDVVFVMDAGSASCPAGAWFHWRKDADNNKAVYASLLAAMMNGKRVNAFFEDGDTSCTAKFIHILAQ